MKPLTYTLVIICCLLSFSIFLGGIFAKSGLVYLGQGRGGMAIADFAIASYLNPFSCECRYFCGQVLCISGDLKSGIEWFSAVQRRSPKFLLTNELKQEAERRLK